MNPAKVGHYEIRRRLGAGGMAEVFLARDTRLGRDVALKILPDSFAADAGRMARFEREARVLASLNHPNIATLHGVEESGGKKALVMELVSGEDLSQRIARGAIPLGEAISIAVQVARALEAAHQKGVIHRDLKPANVRLTDSGQVKVLDFGLAKSAEAEPAGDADLSQSPTQTQQATRSGVILGTAAYMSPEQARGKATDARSDIFAFGALLFEMLSGGRAFDGNDTSETIASIIKGDVRWDRLPPGVPEPVRRLIMRCLEGRIEERYQAMGDARIDLTGFLTDPAALAAPGPARAGPLRGPALLMTAVALGSVLTALVATWVLRARSPALTLPLTKFRLDAPGAVEPVLSPDGSSIAYLKDNDVWLRRMDQMEAKRFDLPWEVSRVAWSHDSRTLVLVQGSNYQIGDLWRVPVEGGEPQMITQLPAKGFLYGVSARDDDELLLGMAAGGLHSVALRGGEPRLLLPAAENEVLATPRVLPNGRDIIFCEAARGRIEAFDGRERRIVLEIEGDRIADPVYSGSGHLLFSLTGGKSSAGIWAVPFSAERLATTGAPFRILPGGAFSLSRNDTLAFLESSSARSTLVRLVWVDRRGSIVGRIGEPIHCGTSARRVGEPIRLRGGPAISPDGRRVAVSGFADEEAVRRSASDIFVFDLTTGARYQLQDDIGRDDAPFWRNGGKTIGFATSAPGIRNVRERTADEVGDSARIVVRSLWATAARDGRYLVYWGGPRTSAGTFYYMEEGSAEGHPFLGGVFSIGDLSPDNRFFAHTIASAPGIFLTRFPKGPGLIPVTSEDAWAPRWRRDGKELFFWREDALMAVAIDSASDDPRTGEPYVLFSAKESRLLPGPNYDIAIGGRFLMLQRTEEEPKGAAPDPGIVIIQNWPAEFGPGTSG